AGAAAALAIAAAGGWWFFKIKPVGDARARLPELQSLIEREEFERAFRLRLQMASYLEGDPQFERASTGLMFPFSVHTSPEGAELFVKGYNEPDADWIPFGRSPQEGR